MVVLGPGVVEVVDERGLGTAMQSGLTLVVDDGPEGGG